MTIDFNKWVSENNPAPSANYSKGFWDYIENMRRLSHLLSSAMPGSKDVANLSVVGTISYQTPPPTETIRIPVVKLETPRFSANIVWWFSVEGFLPSYLVAVTEYSIKDDDFYEFESLLAYETHQNEFEHPHLTNEQHVVRFFEKSGPRVVLDKDSERTPPFSLNPHDLFYENKITSYSFDEFWKGLKNKDSELYAKKPLLCTLWSYESLYSSLSLLNRISTPKKD